MLFWARQAACGGFEDRTGLARASTLRGRDRLVGAPSPPWHYRRPPLPAQFDQTEPENHLPDISLLVAVGTPVAGCPRSDPYVRNYLIRLLPRVLAPPTIISLWRTRSSPFDASARLCIRFAAFWSSRRAGIGRRLSLHRLRGDRRPVVRRLLRYHVAVRLLGGSNGRITAVNLPCRPCTGCFI